MRLKTAIIAAAAASLIATPVVLKAAGAERAAAPIDAESALSNPESATQLIVLALVAAAIIGGILLFDEDEPVSA